jgi:hypothetical protein
MSINYDLTGIRLLRGTEELLPWFVGTPSEPRIRSYLEAKDNLAAYAQDLGGHVITLDQPAPPSNEWPTYRLEPPGWRNNTSLDLLDQLLKSHDDLRLIPRVDAIRLSSNEQSMGRLYERLEGGNPFILAYTRLSRGHGKYLIERSEQLQSVRHAVDKLTKAGHGIAQRLEVRPFIETPSDHYTSYRIVASAVGTLLSAGLIYSGHTTDEDRIIENDRFYDTWKEMRLLKEYLENPNSPYFLASRDIRSNISSGGGVIPLMKGLEQAPITPREKRILEAHNTRGAIAKSMRQIATFLGKTCGPELDLCLGMDYLEDKLTGEGPLLEINLVPDATTYNKCWLGGKATRLEAMYQQRRRALEDIALHAPQRRKMDDTM